MQGPFGRMPMFDLKGLVYKIAILFGAILVIYGVLWLLAELKIIPVIFFAIFPQIVLILIGAFIIYYAYSHRNAY